jgi:uncharacterized membrane protein
VIARLSNPRVLGVLLAASLGANLFLGGWLAGQLTGEATQARRNLDAIVAPLPEAKRALVRKEVRAAMPEVRRNFQAMQAARAALAEEFVKPDPDPAAIDRHFREVQARTTAIQADLQQAFKRAAVSLTPEERRAVIESLKRRPQRGLPEL